MWLNQYENPLLINFTNPIANFIIKVIPQTFESGGFNLKIQKRNVISSKKEFLTKNKISIILFF